MSRVMQINLRDELKKIIPNKTPERKVNKTTAHILEPQQHYLPKSATKVSIRRPLRKEPVKAQRKSGLSANHTRSTSSCELPPAAAENPSKQLQRKTDRQHLQSNYRPNTSLVLPVNIPFLKEVCHQTGDLPFDIILKSRNSYNEDSEDFIMMDDPIEMGLEVAKHYDNSFFCEPNRKESTMECTFKPSMLKEQLSEALRSTAHDNDSFGYVSSKPSNKQLNNGHKGKALPSKKHAVSQQSQQANRSHLIVAQYRGKLSTMRRALQANRKESLRQPCIQQESHRRKTRESNSSISKDRSRHRKVSPSDKENRAKRTSPVVSTSKNSMGSSLSKHHQQSTEISAKKPGINRPIEHVQQREYERVINELHRKIQRIKF